MSKQSRPDAPSRAKAAYRVLLLNDEQTPMVFVVSVLERFFHMTSDAACELMLRVHHKGSAVCGTYSHEEATRLVDDVTAFARSYRHPLQFVIDPKKPS
jgi:ATP-dependent Clp protease adaptor protein ClpS